MEEFDRVAQHTRQAPVQILKGNVLRALAVARENNLGSVSLYSDMEGATLRGIVVYKSRVDLSVLPVSLPSGAAAAAFLREALKRRAGDEDIGGLAIWASDKTGPQEEALLQVRVGRESAVIEAAPVGARSLPFYRERAGLHELLFRRGLPDEADIAGGRLRRRRIDVDLEADGVDRMCGVLTRLDGAALRTYGRHREIANAAIAAAAAG